VTMCHLRDHFGEMAVSGRYQVNAA